MNIVSNATLYDELINQITTIEDHADERRRAEIKLKEIELSAEGIDKQLGNWFDPVTTFTIGSTWHYSYREVGPNWDAIDILMPTGPAEEKSRFSRRWKWKNNSCAVDAVLCLALHLNAWRIQADQSPTPNIGTGASQVLYSLARMPWGAYNDSQRTNIRDLLKKHVAEVSDKYNDPSEARPIDEAYENVFKGLPQVSCLTVRRVECCDANHSCKYERFSSSLLFAPKPHPDCDPRAPTKQLPPRRTDELLQSVFEKRKMMRSKKDACGQTDTAGCASYTRELLVVGRPPPVISVSLFGDDIGPVDLKDIGIIKVPYVRWDGEADDNDKSTPLAHEAQYKLRAVIYHTNGRSHYVVESTLQEEATDGRVHMDMLTSGTQPSKCAEGSWDLVPSEPPAILVFKRCTD